MARLDRFKKCVDDFASDVDFVTMYIEEAHPTDGWVLSKNPYTIHSHANMEERLTAAAGLQKRSLPCPLVVDTMTNEGSLTYGATPERLYVIDDGILRYVGRPGPTGYNVDELRNWLEAYIERKRDR